MNTPEAIKELTDLEKVGLNRLTPKEKKAIGLGKEALIRHQVNRAPGRQDEYFLLPGETEET